MLHSRRTQLTLLLLLLVADSSCMFTGADIAAICKEAAFRALREDIEAKTVRLRHFETAWDQRAEATATYTTPATTNPDF